MPDAVSSDILPNTSTKLLLLVVHTKEAHNTVPSFSWNRRLDIEVPKLPPTAA